MQTSVDLQDPFSYSTLPIVILVSVIIASLIALAAVILIRKKLKTPVKEKKKPEPVPVFRLKGKEAAQREYLEKIAVVERQYQSGEIDARTAHQELSAIVRLFVHDLTGINAQNFSLNELKAHNVYQISSLIEEFYAPEFAERAEKETMTSIAEAREVIMTWN